MGNTACCTLFTFGCCSTCATQKTSQWDLASGFPGAFMAAPVRGGASLAPCHSARIESCCSESNPQTCFSYTCTATGTQGNDPEFLVPEQKQERPFATTCGGDTRC